MKREDTRVTALGEHSRGRHEKGKMERDRGGDHKADKMEIQGRAGAEREAWARTPLEKGVSHSFPRVGVLALVLSEFLVFSSGSDFFFLDLNVFFYKMQVTRLKDE